MKHAAFIFLLSLAVYTLTAGGHLYSPDDEILFRVTQSLWEDYDLAIRPMAGFATSKAKDGNEYAQYGIGQPILAMPFYLAGKIIAPLASDSTWRRIYGIPADERDGARDFPYTAAEIAPRFACSFFNIFVGAAMAALLYLLLFEMTRHHPASLRVTLLYAFGSLAWPHTRPFFTESLAVLLIILAWYLLLRGRHVQHPVHGAAKTRNSSKPADGLDEEKEVAAPLPLLAQPKVRMTLCAALAGAATGYAALVRQDSILMYPGLAFVLLGPIRQWAAEHKPRVHPFVAFCVPAACCGAIMLLLNTLHFGGPFKSGYSDQPEGVKFPTPLILGLYSFLFSAGKGIFFFSPPLVLNFWSWCAMARRNKWLAHGALASALIPLLFMSKWQNWSGGWCWGPRHVFMIHPFLAISIAFWLIRFWQPTRRKTTIIMLGIGAFVQLFGVSEDFIEFHRVFFRSPGSNFHVLYDEYDAKYWGNYYQLAARTAPDSPPQPVPLTLAPAPIQHSLYFPQSTVWAGYPEMMREGIVDNLWWRIISG
ncbi:phospholipid carrier-dependent glycosyltransferase [Candidatus Sumerlaeota bacterium]|nr:phospholipid carrier-dependent glycosyltransferase [Candidatus Sumerlaeota bacterium]